MAGGRPRAVLHCGGREADGRAAKACVRWQALEAGTPLSLFPARLEDGVTLVTASHQYAVSSDGQRFLINMRTEPPVSSPVTLILNWKPEKP